MGSGHKGRNQAVSTVRPDRNAMASMGSGHKGRNQLTASLAASPVSPPQWGPATRAGISGLVVWRYLRDCGPQWGPATRAGIRRPP